MKLVKLRGLILDLHHHILAAHHTDAACMHTFVWATHQAMRDAPPQLDQSNLFLEMADVAQVALDLMCPNCGFWDDLPWFGEFNYPTAWMRKSGRLCKFCSPDPAPFRRLVEVLTKSAKLGLLTGQIIHNLPFLQLIGGAPPEILHDMSAFDPWMRSNFLASQPGILPNRSARSTDADGGNA